MSIIKIVGRVNLQNSEFGGGYQWQAYRYCSEYTLQVALIDYEDLQVVEGFENYEVEASNFVQDHSLWKLELLVRFVNLIAFTARP